MVTDPGYDETRTSSYDKAWRQLRRQLINTAKAFVKCCGGRPTRRGTD